ncbi:protein IQ-DOMAIN 12-like isoform X2 [Daucus carota subsp. sativus]|uniref:protein IQ-DOMAIN 12-like isoform X2 n=1 Tax=Daucus carota subsp. sativus TaxID=79200 RepID=UPI00308359C6
MGKKKSWLSAVKRLFIPEGKREEDKSKRWGWFFGGIKTKQLPAISVPQRTLIEANEEQRKHAMVVAVATAAAAEAAVSAAHAAAEVVRLTSTPSNFGKTTRNLAATKIQTYFRAYLARKALKALKGVVLLQAVIRGQNVRRQIITHMKSLQSILKPQSQVHQIHVPTSEERCVHGNDIQSFSPKKMLVNKDENNKLGCKSSTTWDYSLFTEEDMEVSWLPKKDGSAKRDRMKKSYSHRERPNNIVSGEYSNKEDGGKRPWFEELQDVKIRAAKKGQKFKEKTESNFIDIVSTGRTQHKLKNVVKGESMEVLNSSLTLPRRSFSRTNKKEYSIVDDTSLPHSPVFPAYMAATESAKAKIRSASTPRQRLAHIDFSSVHNSLYKPVLSSWTSWDGELPEFRGKGATSLHKSQKL